MGWVKSAACWACGMEVLTNINRAIEGRVFAEYIFPDMPLSVSQWSFAFAAAWWASIVYRVARAKFI